MQSMRIDLHIHMHGDEEVLQLLRKFEREGIKVAESPEVKDFREKVSAALDNIAADIQRLLDRPNSLSQEDKDALAAIAARASDVAAVVPE